MFSFFTFFSAFSLAFGKVFGFGSSFGLATVALEPSALALGGITPFDFCSLSESSDRVEMAGKGILLGKKNLGQIT